MERGPCKNEDGGKEETTRPEPPLGTYCLGAGELERKTDKRGDLFMDLELSSLFETFVARFEQMRANLTVQKYKR